jgi:hypothetical protein|eukprot:gene8909-7382_t
MLALLASTLAYSAAGVPATPQQWTSRSATYSNNGIMPGCVGGETLSFLYDFDNRRQKQIWTSGSHAGYTDVMRYDKKVPGEIWSRGYHWKPGQEAGCCYFDLCTSQPCSASTAQMMEKIEVPSGATDEGPSGAHGEHWFKDMSIKFLNITNINDWIVDTSNGMAISNWTSKASLPKVGSCHSTKLYGEVTLGNLTEDDFAYPRLCDNMCGESVMKSLRF